MRGFLDNKNLGYNWKDTWNGKQKEYNFGDNLNKEDKKKSVN